MKGLVLASDTACRIVMKHTDPAKDAALAREETRQSLAATPWITPLPIVGGAIIVIVAIIGVVRTRDLSLFAAFSPGVVLAVLLMLFPPCGFHSLAMVSPTVIAAMRMARCGRCATGIV